jgi:HPt (histidine-containing phosphotransfer) domain-containing protein
MNYKFIDLSYLKRISSGDIEFMQEMIQTFINDTPEMLRIIEVEFKRGNLANVNKMAHKMKPSMVFMGIVSGKDLLVTLEELSNQNEQAELKDNLEMLKQVSRKAIMELKHAIYSVKLEH